MAKTIALCAVNLLSVSPKLFQRITVLTQMIKIIAQRFVQYQFSSKEQLCGSQASFNLPVGFSFVPAHRNCRHS